MLEDDESLSGKLFKFGLKLGESSVMGLGLGHSDRGTTASLKDGRDGLSDAFKTKG